MVEFVVGALVATYVLGVAFFLWDEFHLRPYQETRLQRLRRNWRYVPIILAWPIAIVVAPTIRFIQGKRRS